jgi:hypothetical protein
MTSREPELIVHPVIRSLPKRLELKFAATEAVMKNRVILSFVMASGLALAAAPKANAVSLPECGHSYAFQVHGAEPSTINNEALSYIVGIGQITFGPLNSDGRCAVAHLEMIYNDDDVVGFSAGAASCNVGSGATIPCFDGGDHQAVPGLLTPSSNGNGAAALAIMPSFNWLNDSTTSTSLPLVFTLQATTGASTIIGTSVPMPREDFVDNPVLTITMQKQSTTVTLPVSGPIGPGSALGVAPFLGNFVLSFDRFGAPAADPYAFPITGAFGSAVGAFQIFLNTSSGGSLSFNTNANIGYATTDNDCPFIGAPFDFDYADGTTIGNLDFGQAYAPPSTTCARSLSSETNFWLDGVVWGPSDTSAYLIETGYAISPPNITVPAGEMLVGTSYPSAPAGLLTNQVQTTLVAPKKTSSGYVKSTNTTPVLCDVTAALTSVTDGVCSLSLVSFPLVSPEPVMGVANADSPSTQYATTDCTCTTSGPADSVSSTLTITSDFCQFSGTGTASPSTTSYSITCKN